MIVVADKINTEQRAKNLIQTLELRLPRSISLALFEHPGDQWSVTAEAEDVSDADLYRTVTPCVSKTMLGIQDNAVSIVEEYHRGLGWYDQTDKLHAQLKEIRRAMCIVMRAHSVDPLDALVGNLPKAYTTLQEREQEIVEEIRKAPP